MKDIDLEIEIDRRATEYNTLYADKKWSGRLKAIDYVVLFILVTTIMSLCLSWGMPS